MSVVELKPKTRHSVGDAVCGNCRHEWVAAAPAGTTHLECPKCATHRGAFKHPCGPCEGDESFKCDCGSFDFYISRKPGHASGAVYCRGCGNEATGWFE